MRSIAQTVTLPAPPERLFDIYLSSREHGAAIGSTARVSRRPGGPFAAFDGVLRGQMLAILPKRLIVQSWRGSDWRKSEPDSILVLAFSPARRGGRITLVHAHVPTRHRAGIRSPGGAISSAGAPGDGRPRRRARQPRGRRRASYSASVAAFGG
jgi:activator of HSP90 ATPase